MDDLRRMLVDGASPDLSGFASVSLPAAFELSCALIREASRSRAFLEELAKRHGVLGTAVALLDGAAAQIPADFSAPWQEVRRTPTCDELTGTAWPLFVQRFCRSLRDNGGFQRELALGLSKAMQEMVDNVLQHSVGRDEVANGLLGYEVSDGRMVFAVADIGQGVLASLRKNPAWSHLPNAASALRSAVRDRASSRIGQGPGEGFHQVLRALMDLDGILRFRSDDAALTLDGIGAARRETTSSSPNMAGLQLSISCGRRSRV